MPVNIDPNQFREMERTPLNSPETLRVRCPHCQKLYLVQFNDIQEAKPRFECVQCHARFWLSLPDMDLKGEVQGIPLQIREIPRSARLPSTSVKRDPCPKCFKPMESGRADCPSCGVVLEKFKSTALNFTEGVPPHSVTLQALWKRLIVDYSEEQTHSEFLRACQRERNLAYAAAQYGAMLKLMPSDEVTLKKIKEIQALGLQMLPLEARRVRLPRPYPRLWQVPLMGATLVLIVGMVLPIFRNMVGLGALLLFFAFALRLHFRSKV